MLKVRIARVARENLMRLKQGISAVEIIDFGVRIPAGAPIRLSSE